jgi:hypothetical protein
MSILQGDSDMYFYLDGDLVGAFAKNGLDMDVPYQYNVPVYVNESLPHTTHTFSLVNGRSGGNEALVLLDSIKEMWAIAPRGKYEAGRG